MYRATVSVPRKPRSAATTARSRNASSPRRAVTTPVAPTRMTRSRSTTTIRSASDDLGLKVQVVDVQRAGVTVGLECERPGRERDRIRHDGDDDVDEPHRDRGAGGDGGQADAAPE